MTARVFSLLPKQMAEQMNSSVVETSVTDGSKGVEKSFIVFDIKPCSSETDLTAMEKAVRTIEADGLVWGQAKQVPLVFGLYKLEIACVVEDDKIGTDFLEEKICELEDYVQSVEVIIFNKI